MTVFGSFSGHLKGVAGGVSSSCIALTWDDSWSPIFSIASHNDSMALIIPIPVIDKATRMRKATTVKGDISESAFEIRSIGLDGEYLIWDAYGECDEFLLASKRREVHTLFGYRPSLLRRARGA